ncbi:hypothetical protein [Vibrio rotiferianus]|uniref:hypothetical protein n=1 Tax=Vibrio rotiferianus TaxID=190895 RepID=UPI0015F6135B|nr:hypothetical protein [Vibrio rotiferianus]
MEIRHNNVLIATIGDVVGEQEVQAFLLANGLNIPINEVELIYTESEATQSRKIAYKAESDPLYMEWQYDQTVEKEQAWREKVAEIKARYPLPSES